MILKPYQKTGVEFLASRRHALLADDPRLGKSAQAIRAALQAGHTRILVLCPAVVRSNWAREFTRWGWPHPVVTLLSTRQVVPLPDHVAVIASYEAATTPPAFDRLRAERWDLLVADECHYLKTRSAKRTYAVYGPEGLARSSHAMWSLSGTPAPNNIAELWPLMRCYGVTKLKYQEFLSAYCDVRFDGKIVGTSAVQVETLRKLLAPVMLRRRRKDVAPELPPIHFTQQTVDAVLNLPTEFQGVGPHAGEDVIAWMEAHAAHFSTLRRLLGLSKVKPVAEQLRIEFPEGKVVVFAEHLEVIAALRHELASFCPTGVIGATPPDERDRAIDRFQHDPCTRAFIAQIRAAGVGIDLSAADHVAIVEPSWVPADNVQAASRAQGFDKLRPVTATYFSVQNSLDDQIMAALVRKSADFAAVFDVAPIAES